VKNVTITLDESTAQWARQAAAERGVSVSRFVGDLLRDEMKHAASYELAMKRFLAVEPRPLKPAGKAYPRREDLYDRPRVR
jgi:hypothetical protein